MFKHGKKYEYTDYDEKGYVKTGMEEEYHFTKWCIGNAIDWIRYSTEEKQQMPDIVSPPWFYNINLFDPHHAFDPPKRLLDKYLKRAEDLPLPSYRAGELDGKTIFQKLDHQSAYNNTAVAHHFSFDEMSDYEHRIIKAAYYAMVEMIDIQFGRLMNALEETGEDKNTIVIFTSDHGEMLGDHGIYLKGPYFYEPMVHVPLIFSWKDHFPGGRQLDTLTELTDLTPTIEELCLGTIEQGVQGRSLAAILTGEQDPDTHRSSVYSEYCEAMPWHTKPEAYGSMVFDGRYKLSRYCSSKEGELYDLMEDPNEFYNLWDSPSHKDIKIRMLELLADRLEETVDPLPLPTDKW